MKNSQFLKNLSEVDAVNFLFQAYNRARGQLTLLKWLLIVDCVLLGGIAFFEAWMWAPLGGFSTFVVGRGLYYLGNVLVMTWIFVLVFWFPHRMFTVPLRKYHIPEHLQSSYDAYCEMLKFPHIKGPHVSSDGKELVRD